MIFVMAHSTASVYCYKFKYSRHCAQLQMHFISGRMFLPKIVRIIFSDILLITKCFPGHWECVP